MRSRIVVGTCVVSMLFAATLSTFYYLEGARAAETREVANMGETARLLATSYRNLQDQVRQDAVILAASPTLHAFLHSVMTAPRHSEHHDLRPLVDLEATARDLSIALLRSRPEYLQLSVVSTQDNGRELLRAVREGGKISSSAAEGLQRRDVALRLPGVFGHHWADAPTTGSGTAHLVFLNSALNPGPGRAVVNNANTITVAYPVYHEGMAPFGFIVLVMDMRTFVASTFAHLPDGESAYLQTPSGLFHHGPNCSACLVWPSQMPAKVATLLSDVRASGKQNGAHFGSDTLSYFVRMHTGDAAHGKDSILLVQEPKARVMAAVNAIALRGILIVFGSLLLVGLLTERLTRRLVRPLKVLEAEAQKARHREEAPHLPVSSSDEVGNVARAVQALLDDYVQSEHRLSTLIENLAEGVITLDARGKIHSFNAACECIFGWKAGEVLGRQVEMLMPKEMAAVHQSFLSRFQEQGRQNAPLHAREVLGLRKDGRTFPMELTVSNVQIDGEVTLIGIVRDISERRIAEKAKAEFVATVSHELRTPLTSIHGALRLMGTEKVAENRETVLRLATVATQNSQRLMRLINNILDIEKLESLDLPIIQKPMKLRPVIESAISSFEGYGQEADVSFEFIDTGTDATVLIDAERITQVIANLLSNAAKFSHPGAPVRVSIARLADENMVRVLVEDEGCGIPEAAQATIFEKFTQVDSSDQRKFEGAGLGLNIARTIVERHGGRIGLYSTVESGSTFYFDLAIENVSHDARKTSAPRPAADMPQADPAG